MARTTYRRSSPYFETDQNNLFLDVYNDRDLNPSDTDEFITIPIEYEYRPDLLSSELYGSPDFWWVFARRNMDLIKDPIYDFKAGLEIRTPPASFITNLNG